MQSHLTQSPNVANSAAIQKKTFNERMLQLIEAEIHSYRPSEIEALMGDYYIKDIAEKEEKKRLIFLKMNIDDIDKREHLIRLYKDHEQMQKAIESEEIAKEAEKIAKESEYKPKSRLVRYFTAFLGIDFFSIFGLFTNMFHLVGGFCVAIANTVVFATSLMVLALSTPVGLSTMILGMGVELINAIKDKKTPQRGTIIASNFALLGLAGTVLMPFVNVLPFFLMGLPVVPLLFAGIVAISYYKDKKRLDYIDSLIAENNKIIEDNDKQLCQELYQQLYKDNSVDPTKPKVQRLVLIISEAKKKNEILQIQRQTLTRVRFTYKISGFAVGILIVSAFIFPPLSIGAAFVGALGMGIILGIGLHNKNLRDAEKKLINETKQEHEQIPADAIQQAFESEIKDDIKERIKLIKLPKVINTVNSKKEVKKEVKEAKIHRGPMWKPAPAAIPAVNVVSTSNGKRDFKIHSMW